MTRGRRFQFIAGGVAALTLATSVEAAPAFDLRWMPPVGCPSHDEVVRELEAVLKDSTVDERLMVDATITPPETTRAWQLELVFSGAGRGRRHLEGESCEALARSAILVIAMVYDPLFVPPETQPPAAPPAPTAPPPTTPSPSPVPTPTPPMAQTPRAPLTPPTPVVQVPPPPEPWMKPRPPLSRPRLGARLGSLGTVGMLPRPTIGIEGGFVVRWPVWTLTARASYTPPVRQRLETRPNAGGDLDQWTVGAQGCFQAWAGGPLGPGGYDVRLCAAFDAGQLRAEGFGVDSPESGQALWLAPEAGAALDVHLTRWLLLDLGLGLTVPVLRPTFVLENVGDVHRPEPVAGRLGLGAQAVF